MDFNLSEEQRMLQDSLVKFVGSQYAYEQRRKLAQSSEGFSRDYWKQYAELGWLCLPFSEDDGGINAGPVETMLVMDALGKGLALEPYLSTVVLCGGLLRRAADAAQRSRWVSGIIEGSVIMALAQSEPGDRYDTANVAATAKAEGDRYVLNGRKSFVVGGASADAFIVVARTSGGQTDPQGVSLFIVERNAPGLTVQTVRCLDGHRAAELVLDNVSVEAAALLGEPGVAVPLLEVVTAEATLAVSAEAVGIMERLYKDTVEYTKTRKQFGMPIAVFQALQHRMVDMFTAHEQAKSLLYKAVLSLQDGEPDTARSISALKHYVSTTGQKVAHEAVQIHGGMGMTEEMSVGVYLKRINVIATLFGNGEMHLRRFMALPA